MTHPHLDVRLIVITDEAMAFPRSVRTQVGAALRAGAPMIQLRDKNKGARELTRQAEELVALAEAAGARLIVNDRVDVALASGAHGVHLGPDDLGVAAVRAVVPSQFVIGYSTDDPERAKQAQREGADYVGCGAVYSTRTKDVGDEAIGLDGLAAVVEAVSIPVVAIGGISEDRAAAITGTGAAGVAVVSAVMDTQDPGAMVRALLDAVRGSALP